MSRRLLGEFAGMSAEGNSPMSNHLLGMEADVMRIPHLFEAPRSIADKGPRQGQGLEIEGTRGARGSS
jgi:hypothetical protein